MSEQLTPIGKANDHYLQMYCNESYHHKSISAESLSAYQRLQMKHDEIYHHEIFVLGVSQRMNHVVLHLIKYLGVLFSLPVSSLENRRAFIDSFIMIVSASNLLGISLARNLSTEEVTSPDGIFINEYIQLLAKLAKACEATDHQEDYPIRATWNKNIQDFFSLLVREAISRDISILKEASHRLTSVEMNHPIATVLQGEE
ncbi:MAG: hypothetical protein HC780_00335 [Leptolyngbyaceae cyanobacterium CSU_1_3]|nr:hypothetical protein [Leptolyngbyaceae cyanobacterium CSU_1_3]